VKEANGLSARDLVENECAERTRAGGDDAIPDSSLVTGSPVQFSGSVLLNEPIQ